MPALKPGRIEIQANVHCTLSPFNSAPVVTAGIRQSEEPTLGWERCPATRGHRSERNRPRTTMPDRRQGHAMSEEVILRDCEAFFDGQAALGIGPQNRTPGRGGFEVEGDDD
jgi:hypothetical protein